MTREDRKKDGEAMLDYAIQKGPLAAAEKFLSTHAEQSGKESTDAALKDILAIGFVAYAMMMAEDAAAQNLFGDMFTFVDEDEDESEES